MVASTIQHIELYLCAGLPGKWTASIQPSQTFLWVLKASWTILESIWQSCSRAGGEAVFSGRCWHVNTSDVFSSGVTCHGVWLWARTGGASFLFYCAHVAFYTFWFMHAGRRVCLLTVNLLRSCVCEKHAHHLLEVAAGLGCVTVLAHVVQHPLQDVIQGGGGLIQQDGGPRQEAIQVPVCPNFLLEVHQLHILEKSQNCQNESCFCRTGPHKRC